MTNAIPNPRNRNLFDATAEFGPKNDQSTIMAALIRRNWEDSAENLGKVVGRYRNSTFSAASSSPDFKDFMAFLPNSEAFLRVGSYENRMLRAFYERVCGIEAFRAFEYPSRTGLRDRLCGIIACGFIPNFLYIFDDEPFLNNSEYFNLQKLVFEMFATIFTKTIYINAERYFDVSVVAVDFK
jgi:hypothetical protein